MLGLWAPIFGLIGIVIGCIFVVIEWNEKSLYYILITLCFFEICFTPLEAVSEFNSKYIMCGFWSFIAGIQLIRYLISFIKKPKDTFIIPFILLGLFTIYTLLPIGVIQLNNSLILLVYFSIVLAFALYYKSFLLKHIVYMICGGVIISCLLVPVAKLASSFTDFLIFDHRFTGLLNNPGVLCEVSAMLVFALLYLFYKNKINILFYPLIFIIMIISILTESRIFFIGIAFIIPAYIIFMLVKYKKQRLLSLCISLVFIVIPFILVPNSTRTILDRFGSLIDDNINRVSFTQTVKAKESNEQPFFDPNYDPARAIRNANSIKSWTASPKNFLFGTGLGDYLLIEESGMLSSEHNSILYLLRRTGIIGTLMIIAFFISLIYYMSDRKFRFNFYFSSLIAIYVFLNLFISPVLEIFYPVLIQLILLPLILADDTKKITRNPNATKVLHIVGFASNDGIGGVETFVRNARTEVEQQGIVFDFVQENKEFINNNFFKETKEHKSDVFYIPKFKLLNWFEYEYEWSNFFEENPNYAAVHMNFSPHAFFIPLHIAKTYGIKTIFHVHGSLRNNLIALIIQSLFFLNKATIDYRVSTSDQAGKRVFGKLDFKTIINGIDVEKYKFNNEIRERKRQELNLKKETIILNVARIDENKNQKFLIEVLSHILKTNANYKLILCGTGEEGYVQSLKQYAKELACIDNTLFLGSRNDIAEIVQAADIFCFPSILEGLGIVMIEAQASGLPCVASTGVPINASVTDGLVKYLNLSDGAEIWAKEIISISQPLDRVKYNNQVMSAGYDSKTAYKCLHEFYKPNK